MKRAHSFALPPSRPQRTADGGFLRADDGDRTRDPWLAKQSRAAAVCILLQREQSTCEDIFPGSCASDAPRYVSAQGNAGRTLATFRHLQVKRDGRSETSPKPTLEFIAIRRSVKSELDEGG